MQPDWYTLADYLIEQFPARRAEIEETYFDQLEVLANPYPHAFLEEFLARLLYGALPNAEEGDRLRAGRILDELLTSSDEDLAGAAIVSILELLRDNPPLREAAQPFLGPVASSWLSRLMESLQSAEPRSGKQ